MQTAFGSTPRETIYAGLLTQLAAATGIQGSSRRLLHWTKVDPSAMPALFVAQVSEVTPSPATRGLPYRWTLKVNVYIYVSVGQDSEAVPASKLNPIIDAVESVVNSSRLGERNTLNNLVYDCRIVGQILTDEGTLGATAVAIVPVEILA